MITPLSKIKDVVEPKKQTFTLTLYRNGNMYIPKAMGGVSTYVSYNCTDETIEIYLNKCDNYKAHVYIPTQATRILFYNYGKCNGRDNGDVYYKQIRIAFQDGGCCYQKETPEE